MEKKLIKRNNLLIRTEDSKENGVDLLVKTHSNDECIRQKQDNSKSNVYNLIIQEKAKTPSKLVLKDSFNDFSLECVINTGAQQNYINRDLAENIKLTITVQTISKRIKVANGKEVCIITFTLP